MFAFFRWPVSNPDPRVPGVNDEATLQRAAERDDSILATFHEARRKAQENGGIGNAYAGRLRCPHCGEKIIVSTTK